MNDIQMQLLIDLHKSNLRQGPGGEAETKKMLKLADIDKSKPLKIADIGCGTGNSSILLAKELNAQITAVDFLPEFLEVLQSQAKAHKEHKVAEKITTLNCSMDSLPFATEEFDLIFSEGAIYNMGFEAGVADWKRFLKPGGKLIVSEITWLTAKRPQELQAHWDAEYPEIDVASAKIKILEQHGYCLEAYFYLPVHCWKDNYYLPMQKGFDAFLERNGQSTQAKEIVEGEKAEIALYEKYSDYYSYGVYIARKL
ncbi:class I SAM-dependent methyltransferase [Desulfovibrio litoralis]|uniref:Methyltransferase domain-containing protein n=1 Tax=Desulfovibrio litoralis DSM 11393 TaxID=1121455 RepID=A0A1M7SN22_9BACT|nr:class I SAM-dependent methyltransferase [Desulfovibrio litoralis]SHN59867.1 Methyltransferase domain-containing protein [Desulfovibrio litoralis DSM 11393]